MIKRIWKTAALIAFAGAGTLGASLFGPPKKALAAIHEPCASAAFAPYDVEGSGRIEGQAFLKTRGGDVKTAAGNEVLLVPAVDCAAKWWAVAALRWIDIRATQPESPVFREHLKSTVADGEGRFVFARLPPGGYYLRTVVQWQIPGQYGPQTEGGLIGQEVTLADGETKSVVLTR